MQCKWHYRIILSLTPAYLITALHVFASSHDNLTHIHPHMLLLRAEFLLCLRED